MKLTIACRLQGQGLQEAHVRPPYVPKESSADQTTGPQGHPVQEGQGLHLRAGEASLRPQAERLRWSDEACLPQEGALLCLYEKDVPDHDR